MTDHPNKNKLHPNRIYAINQYKGVLEMLSKTGLVDMLTKTYKVDCDPTASKDDLIKHVLLQEYGKEDMEKFNAQ